MPITGVEGLGVADRADLLKSALDALEEGAALVDKEGQIAFWNSAAERITGYCSSEVCGRRVRQMLELLIAGEARQSIRHAGAPGSSHRAGPFSIRHKSGDENLVLARVLPLRDESGLRIGTGFFFHSADPIDALPHGRSIDKVIQTESQTQLEDRLVCMHEEFRHGDLPLGVLWVTVDHAEELRQSRGTAACEAMLQTLENTMTSGLKPSEEMGRWGDQGFLVLSHERSEATLASHAQMLAGLARTSDFRWWGDRISLSVSIGAAQAREGESLGTLLKRAQAAAQASIYAGGNHITAAQQTRENW